MEHDAGPRNIAAPKCIECPLYRMRAGEGPRKCRMQVYHLSGKMFEKGSS